MFCSRCGTRLPPSARFCEECGAPLASQAAVVPGQMHGAAVAEQRPPYLAHQAPPYPAQDIQFNPTINVSVAAPPAVPGPAVMVGTQQGVPLVLRALWFVFIGLWLGFLYLIVAWLLNVSIVGLPLGLAMINRVPQVMTLRSPARRVIVAVNGGATFVTMAAGPQQVPFVLRALYFLVIGIWLSLLWMLAAWVAAALLITLPLSFWMFDRLPAVTTLRLT